MWRDEIGKRLIEFPRGFSKLLSQRVKCCEPLPAGLVGIDLDVIVHSGCRPETIHGSCLKQFAFDDLLQQALGVIKHFFRSGADSRILEDLRICPTQLPDVKERCPVNERDKFAQCEIR